MVEAKRCGRQDIKQLEVYSEAVQEYECIKASSSTSAPDE
jgi:hypothetical protein